MKVLITGGAGFIGSHLTDTYIARGDTVYCIDDLTTGCLENIAHLRGRPEYEFEQASVERSIRLQEFADAADLILHLAAAVGVRLVVEDGVRAIDTNLESTIAVLRAAKGTKTPVFLASSSEVYGKSNRTPFVETSPISIGAPSVGRWSYACSKAMGEFLGMAYWKEYDVPVVIGRLFNTSGPRQTGSYGMVIPRFVQQALAGESITVFGDGKQSRCFAHVEDVSGAVMKLMETPEAYGGVFNIGSSEEIAILDLAMMVKEFTGSDSEIVHVSLKSAYGDDFEETYRRVPSLQKIEHVIGYRPQWGLDDIVKSIVQSSLKSYAHGAT